MTVAYNTTLRNAKLNAITAAIDAGSGPGKIIICSGTRPATGGALTTVLAELPMSDPSFPAASYGSMSANAITDDSSANATGTATWGRVVDSEDNFVMDFDVGESGSGADLIMTDTAIVAGGTVSVASFSITAGNA